MNPTQKPLTTMQTGVTPAFILRGAALYLERHGWTQGSHYDFTGNPHKPTPPACVRGAMAIASYGTPVDSPWDADRPERPDFTAAAAFFDDHIDLNHVMDPTDPDADLGAVWWNDRHERSADEVIDALRAAADDWDNAHGGAR